MRPASRAGLAIAIATLLMATLSGCGWRGLNTLPMPGTEGRGPGSYTVYAQLPDVNNLQPNSRVRVGDVTVGTVTRIERQDWHALLTIRLNGDVQLPANATAGLGQTSLLGSLHIELAPPKDEAPQGRLRDGGIIPLASAASYPTTDQTLAAVSTFLNGGGIRHVEEITKAFATAVNGREQDLRSLIARLDTFMSDTNKQTDDIIGATDNFNNLVDKFATQKDVVDTALRTIPDALTVLKDEREKLTELADQLSKFGESWSNSIGRTRETLVAELNDLAPVAESLANAGPALLRALHLFPSYPFFLDTVPNFFRGDAANLTAIIDLTLSRLDASFFTGTKWECDLTELELQWGRTIGQFPSPCLNGGHFNQGNPLTVPYRTDQGA